MNRIKTRAFCKTPDGTIFIIIFRVHLIKAIWVKRRCEETQLCKDAEQKAATGQNMFHNIEHYMVRDLSWEYSFIFNWWNIWIFREHCVRFPWRWMFRFIMMLVQVQNDDDESDRHTIEGGGCKGKCNYWQTGACSSSVMISYHCTRWWHRL